MNARPWTGTVAILAGLSGCFKAKLDKELDAVVDDDAGSGEAKAGDPCTRGTGSCARDGQWIREGAELVCDAVPAPAGAELCSTEQDEDCDGKTDEAPEDGCCEDADCSAGTCNFPQAVDEDSGMTLDLTRQGGTCGDDPQADACDDDRSCAAGLTCVDHRCVFEPPIRLPTAIQHTSGGGVASGQGYVLEVTTGGPNLLGRMSGNGYVLQLRAPTQPARAAR